MRKLRSFLTMAAVAASLAIASLCGGCAPVEPIQPETRSVSFPITVNDWRWDPDLSAYIWRFNNIRELTSEVVEFGGPMMFVIFRDGALQVLPYTDYHFDIPTKTYSVNYSLDWDFSPHTITFIYRGDEARLGSFKFRFYASW